MISFLIHYRGDKVRKFNEWQDDPPRYLDAFVNDDLQTLGLPPPHTCACTWRSGVMKCIWKAEEGRELEQNLLKGFEMIRSDPRCLQVLSMSLVSLHMDGLRMHVPAPGAKAPLDTKYRPPTQATQSSSGGNVLRAPTSISTARTAASPMAYFQKNSRSSHQPSFTPHSNDNISPQPPVKHEESSPEAIPHTPRGHHTLPPKPTLSNGSRMETAALSSPAFSAMSASMSFTSLHLEPDQGVNELVREQSGGHLSISSARKQGLARGLPQRSGSESLSRSSVMTIAEEQEAMQSEVASLRFQVAEESQARRAAELALEQEQRRREGAEVALVDVRREGSAPFIVPSLSEAFGEISRLTGGLLSSSRTVRIN